MARRQRQWAARAYERLVESLGGKCAACGEAEFSKLQIDHIYGITWQHESREWSWRVSTYRQEARLGLVQLLCGPCNLAKRYADKELLLADRPIDDIWNP